MKILHVHEVYLPYKGGSAIRIKNLIEAQYSNFLSSTDQVYVLCTYKGIDVTTKVPAKETINGINIIRVRTFKLIGIYTLLLSIRHQIKHIHIHNSRVFWFVYPFVFFKKIILEIHSLRKLAGFKEFLQTLSLNLSSKLVVLSEATKEYLSNTGIDRRKITVVRNGVDYAILNLQENHKRKADRRLHTLVYAGSFYEWQGIFKILELAELIRLNNDNVEILLIGEGPLKEEVKQRIEEKSLKKYVHLVDFLPTDTLYSRLIECDMFLFLRPARRETELTFPLKILEVGALGVPLVMTKRAAHLEIFNGEDPARYCTLVDDHINNVYNVIIDSLQTKDELIKRAEAFKLFISNQDFSWKNAAFKLNTIYEK